MERQAVRSQGPSWLDRRIGWQAGAVQMMGGPVLPVAIHDELPYNTQEVHGGTSCSTIIVSSIARSCW